MIPLEPVFCQIMHSAFLQLPRPLPCELETCRSRTTSQTTVHGLFPEFEWRVSEETRDRALRRSKSPANASGNLLAKQSCRYPDDWLVRRGAVNLARKRGTSPAVRAASYRTKACSPQDF